MTTTDKLTDEALVHRAVLDWIKEDAPIGIKMQMTPDLANKLSDRIAHRRASQAAPGGCGYPCGYDCNGACFQASTAPSDGLREAAYRAEVERFGCDQLGMEKMPNGEWVRFTDYAALRERAEAAERAHLSLCEAIGIPATALSHIEYTAQLTAARRAESAAWNDAIEAAALEAEWRIMPAFAASIRALRRAAPTEDRCATCGGDCGQC